MPSKPWFANQDFENRIHGLNHLGDVHGKTILDLGCAEGKISEYLVGLGAASAVGYDVSHSRVHANTLEQVTLHQADLNFPERLPPHPSFDIVLLMAVLKQLRNPLRLLVYAAGAVKHGGLLVFRTPIKERGLYTGSKNVRKYLEEEYFRVVKETKAINAEGETSYIGIFRRHKELPKHNRYGGS
jgi:2-polyprenyl-3-methyl-5-hydroxy-6-metoxy-1,4-benzoquinol methylase